MNEPDNRPPGGKRWPADNRWALILVAGLVLLALPTLVRLVREGGTPPPAGAPAGYTPPAIATPALGATPIPTNTPRRSEEIGALPGMLSNAQLPRGSVVVDLAHYSLIDRARFQPLAAALAQKGVDLRFWLPTVDTESIEQLTDFPDLSAELEKQLAGANALVVVSPFFLYTPAEISVVERFVADGGRLLLISDPDVESDSASDTNQLAAAFNVIFNQDYLYDTAANDENFTYFFQGEFLGEAAELAGSRIAFYGGRSIGGAVEPLVRSADSTLSSLRSGLTSFNTVVLGGSTANGSQGRVLALSDFDVLTDPYAARHDNRRMLQFVGDFLAGVPEAEIGPLVTDLGGHDLGALLAAFAECDRVADRPSIVFAYTVKGYRTPLAGNPRNHAALLSTEQIARLRSDLGLTERTEWDAPAPGSRAGALIARRSTELARPPASVPPPIAVPTSTGLRPGKPISTQEAFGRVLVALSREPGAGRHLVTTAPDVATSTNLAGFINRTGVFAPDERRAWHTDPMVRWAESPTGQHIELGISEMNLFLLLGQLGLAEDLSGQRLLPVGTVYDPFVCRGLDAFVYSVYSGARFVVAGTPSGITLAPEGGAHQSTITASIGMELPRTTLLEPAYAGALDWLLCDALGRIGAGTTPGDPETGSYYFRLTTRPVDQSPFEAARDRLGDQVLRWQVLAGAYRLVEPAGGVQAPQVQLAACGAVLPEVLAAAQELTAEGIGVTVVDITSADRLYAEWQRTLRQGIRTARTPAAPGGLRAAFRPGVPLVTVHDAASHALAWLGSALGSVAVPLGVDEFGQSGAVSELYGLHDLLPGSIVNAALAALSLQN